MLIIYIEIWVLSLLRGNRTNRVVLNGELPVKVLLENQGEFIAKK